MLLVALIISHLASRMRSQAQAAYAQEKQATAMHGLSHRLVRSRGIEQILAVALQYISGIFDCRVLALLPDEKGKLHVMSGDPATIFEKDKIKKWNLPNRHLIQAGRLVRKLRVPRCPSFFIYPCKRLIKSWASLSCDQANRDALS